MEELGPGVPAQLGSYRLLRQLGGGGMGNVYLALSPGGRLIAIKVIKPELADDPGFRTRFAREVAAACKVNGLFTASVVAADANGPVPWLATAFVAGPNLAQAVAAHRPLPARSVLSLAAALAESLAAIHQAGVIHRDLKPSNVLLAQDGPRVIDFGISRAVEGTSITQSKTLLGTPAFMSPEQAEGESVGIETDIFSLGSVLTFAATGRSPFGNGPDTAMPYRIVHHEPDLSQLPPELRALVASCLSKQPERRPTTMKILAELGDVEPASNWLPQPFMEAFARYQFSGSERDDGGGSHPPTYLVRPAPPPADMGTVVPPDPSTPTPPEAKLAELAWVVTSQDLAAQVRSLMRQSRLTYEDLASYGTFRFLRDAASIADMFSGRSVISDDHLQELLLACGLSSEERAPWLAARAHVAAAVTVYLRVGIYELAGLLEAAKRRRRDVRHPTHADRALERGSLSGFTESMFRSVQDAGDLVSGRAYRWAQKLQHEVEGRGVTEASLQCSQELMHELMAIPVDASDTDLRHLNITDLPPIEGVIWTPRTQWPALIRQRVSDCSRMIRDGVLQVETPRKRPPRRFLGLLW